jgi:LytS/YehU family sensor histidine kinase
VQLGDILRLALHNDATGLVPLKTELEYIRLYLQIEKTR